LRNLLTASGVAARLTRAAVPVLDFVPALARTGMVPGGSHKNLLGAAPFCTWGPGLADVDRLILADAQTSGGLLIAVPSARADALVRELAQRAAPARAVIGEIIAGEAGRIEVVAG
jgi:selenide, water dikinase